MSPGAAQTPYLHRPTTRLPPVGTSTIMRRCMSCTRPADIPHTEHCTGSSRVRACIRMNSPFVRDILDDRRRESRKHHSHELRSPIRMNGVLG